MPKLTLNDVSNLSGAEQAAISTINTNSNAIETALENTLSRDGSTPNSMNADLDMNSNDIINVNLINGLDILNLKGWTAEFSVASDGDRRVQQVIDWFGGSGSKPDVGQYIGTNGFVSNISDAIDIRGPKGIQGLQGIQGQQGIQGIKGDKGDTGDQGPPGVDGTGAGSVTSVAITGSNGINFSGSPITSNGTFIMSIDAATLRAHLNVEDNADVTDTANVTSAGASMTANNLSDLADAPTARTNLGLGTSSTLDEATAAQYRNNTADKILSTDQVWLSVNEVTLTDAASITVDMNTFINAVVTLGDNRTLANPTNAKVGQTGLIRVVQDGTGSRTLSYGSSYVFSGGTAPTLSTTASAEDYLFYKVISSSVIFVSPILDVQ